MGVSAVASSTTRTLYVLPGFASVMACSTLYPRGISSCFNLQCWPIPKIPVYEKRPPGAVVHGYQLHGHSQRIIGIFDELLYVARIRGQLALASEAQALYERGPEALKGARCDECVWGT